MAKNHLGSTAEPQVAATGSAGPVLLKGCMESDAGRWSVIPIPTLSFYEYRALINAEIPALDPPIRPTAFLRLAQDERSRLMVKLFGAQNHFNRHLGVGGFPELALVKSDVSARQAMRKGLAHKVLERNLPCTASETPPNSNASFRICATFPRELFLLRRFPESETAFRGRRLRGMCAALKAPT